MNQPVITKLGSNQNRDKVQTRLVVDVMTGDAHVHSLAQVSSDWLSFGMSK